MNNGSLSVFGRRFSSFSFQLVFWSRFDPDEKAELLRATRGRIILGNPNPPADDEGVCHPGHSGGEDALMPPRHVCLAAV